MPDTRRKLTTIFSADVHSYSRMMEADEEGTLARLKQSREAMARLIGAHSGRVINTWGDGLLAEFDSVVEAVRAAIDVQHELAKADAATPSDDRMLFRIGINLGDVIVDGDDIYGDGVNIAARLQESAAPGGILISRPVYDQVRNKVSVGFDFLGELSVKNIGEAVPSYAVRVGGEGAEAAPLRPAPERYAPPAPPRSPVPPAPPAVPAGRGLLGGVLPGLGGAGVLPTLGVLAVVVVAVNLLTWSGTFWAAWPLLVFAALAGLALTRGLERPLRDPASMAVIGLGLVGINMLTWHGTFWAKWPLLGLAIAAGMRWIGRQEKGRRGGE